MAIDPASLHVEDLNRHDVNRGFCGTSPAYFPCGTFEIRWYIMMFPIEINTFRDIYIYGYG